MSAALCGLSLGLAAILLSSSPCPGSTVFSDSTFDLTNYSQVIFLDTPSVKITVSQTLTGGNPGAALEITNDVPAGLLSYSSMQGLINNTFVYDPSTQGALATIDASADKYFAVNIPNFNFLSETFRPLIYQGGNYYLAAIPLSTVPGAWYTASQAGLTAADFQLFNFATGAFDPTSHPDFAGGLMEFGLANRNTFDVTPPGSSEFLLDNRYDNLVLRLNAVPEPTGLVLLGLGVSCTLAGMRLRRPR